MSNLYGMFGRVLAMMLLLVGLLLVLFLFNFFGYFLHETLRTMPWLALGGSSSSSRSPSSAS